MSVQRRRGQKALVWKTAVEVDRRGNQVVMSTDTEPHEVRAVFIPQRSSRAELPGQAEINIYKMLVDPDLEDVNLWSRVEWRGEQWDVVSPPALHYGTRRTRHWSMDIRKRP